MAERIATFFGEEMRKHLIPGFLRAEMFALSGYIAPPFFDKANASMQFVFLNGRYIKDSAIFRAIYESYHGKLMHKRYPIVFLFLQVEPSEVDVNVHPTKTEVRFRNTTAIYNYVLSALKEGLNKSTPKSVRVPSFIQRSEKESAQAEEIGLVKKSLWEQFSFGKAGETKDAQDDADLSIPTATGKSDNFASFNKEKIPVAVSGNGSEGRYGELAPPGKCAGLISQMAVYELKDGGHDKWLKMKFREEYMWKQIAKLQQYAPNLTKDKVLETYITAPPDIQNKFANMVKGGYKQGAYHPLQMGYLRPNQECSQYRTPVKNLYVGGSSVAPGGCVIWGSGYNCANAVAEDYGIKKWWSEPKMVTEAIKNNYVMKP